MASQSLYRKWRSQTFDDLVGQEPIIRTLKNALKSGNLAHAYLFTGPRGTGKTTTARLLAKTVNCAHPNEGEPCNECQQCREITAGNSFNVIEIDAASNRGIDSIRDLREKVMMPPSTGKYKVYVLDEAHMLTTEAFNALLKTLEEPPPYVIFVLATTDVHKMLPTVLSRCQRFDFKRLSTRQIVEHLYFVAEHEHIKLERSAAELIARAAAGGMRDALSLLDQAIAYSGEEIALSQVQAMLGVADPRAISKLITHIAELNSSAVLHLIHEVSEAGADLRQINAQVVEYWRALMLARAGADIAAILDLTEDEVTEVNQLVQFFGLEELTECARVFAQNDLVQKNQGTPQLGLELASLEAIEVHRRTQAGQPSAGIAAAGAPAVQHRTLFSQPSAQAQQSSPLRKKGESQESSSDPGIAARQQASQREEMQLASVAGEGGRPSLTVQQVKDGWNKIIKRTRQKNASTGAMLERCTVASVESAAEQVVVVIQASSEPLYKNMQQGNRFQYVEWALTTEFGQQCRMRLVSPVQSLPHAPALDSIPYSANAMQTLAPQQSAYREPAVSTTPTLTEQVEEEYRDTGVRSTTSPLDHSDGASVAKTNIVGENTTVVTPQETIEQKAHRDPVVQEVIKTFGARIVEVHPK